MSTFPITNISFRAISLWTALLFFSLTFTSCQKEVFHTVTTSVEPEGSGRVSPASGPVLEGSSITFRADPQGDYVFTGWSGAITGTENPKTVSATGHMNVVAHFTLRAYPLNITIEGEGTVSESIISTKTDYSSGTIIELTAKPADHWLFDHWEGDITGSTNPSKITVSSAKSVKAVFVKKMYDLTISVEGEGSVSEKVVGTKGSYQEGTLVELTATPDNYWAFDHWEGAMEGSDNPATIVISEPLVIKAVFIEKDPGIQFTETPYVHPQEMWEKMGFGLNLGWHLNAFTWYSRAMIHEWINEDSLNETLDKIVSMGIKSIRLQTTFCGELSPAPEFQINPEWLEKIDMYIDACERHGLIVILNVMHEQLIEDGIYPNPIFKIDFLGASRDPDIYEYERSRNAAIWYQLARHYRNKGDFLIFEAFNEPVTYKYKEDQTDQIKVLEAFTQEFVDIVRSTGGNNASRWLSIACWECLAYHALNTLTLPQDYVSNNRFIVPFHYYAHLFERENMDEWGHTATILNPEIWEQDEEYVRNMFYSMKNKYFDRGIPVILGETGCYNGENERQYAFEMYYLEYVFRCATLCGFPAFLHTIDGPRYVDGSGEIYSETGNFGFYDFAKRKYRPHGEEIEALINKAVYSTDPDYTLEYVYKNAPFQDQSADNPIDIPDPEFKRYLVSTLDKNGDGEINIRETWHLREIEVDTKNIRSLKGVEHFANLQSLKCCGEKEWIADASGPGLLTELDVTQNTHLRHLELCNNHIKTLDLSNNHELETLGVRSNEMAHLDITHCPKLKTFDAGINCFSEIDLSQNSELLHIFLYNNNLSSISIENQSSLEILNVANNRIEVLKVNKNTQINSIEAQGNLLERLDLSNLPKLQLLRCYNNPSLKTIRIDKALQSTIEIYKDDHTIVEYQEMN